MDVAELASHKALVPSGSHVFTAQYGDDRGLFVEFYEEAVYQEFESQKQGKPIYKSVPFIKMFTPGNKTNVIRPVKMDDDERSPSDPTRFPRQWKAFQNQQAQVHDGIPLEQVAWLRKPQIIELKSRDVHTVEQLSALPDSAFHNFGMGIREMRDAAITYLKSAANSGETTRLMAENQNLRTDIDAMKQQLEDMNATMLKINAVKEKHK